MDEEVKSNIKKVHSLTDLSWSKHSIQNDDILLEEENSFTKDSNQVTSTMISMVVASYFLVSMGLVFVNKIIMNDEVFPYPILVTYIQFIVAFCCFYVTSYYSPKLNYQWLNFITKVDFKLETAKKVLPVTIVYLLMLITNNICLYYVEVSFYQIARSLTIIFTVVLTYYILNKTTSMKAGVACLIIVIGFIFGTKGEINFSFVGVVFGVFSSFFVALYGVAIKSVMQSLNDDHWKLLFYNTVMSLILLLPVLLLSGELPKLMESGLVNAQFVWSINLFAGLMGFALNIIMALQIKFTSPLTNIISGTVKSTVQTILAFIIFQTPINLLNITGIVLVLGGSAAYSYVRYREM